MASLFPIYGLMAGDTPLRERIADKRSAGNRRSGCSDSQWSADASDLAKILARAYLRLLETSRTGAVSSADGGQKRLDVVRPESPHVGGHEAA